MKIFIIGLPYSGRTTVAKSLCIDLSIQYVSALDWFKSSFRLQKKDESLEDFEQAYLEFYVEKLKTNSSICIDYINSIIDLNSKCIIDGIVNPYDFTNLFNYNTDLVIFLNRIDDNSMHRNNCGVGVNVIRDYCLYLSTMGLINKSQWLEYNFKIPGEQSNLIKQLGRHNTITISKSIENTIEHLKGELCKY